MCERLLESMAGIGDRAALRNFLKSGKTAVEGRNSAAIYCCIHFSKLSPSRQPLLVN